MRRREFLITLVLSATVPWAHAQQPGKLYRIAIVHPSAPVADLTDTGSPRFIELFKELRRLGYVEGQNVAVERYSGAGQTEHYSELANEVVRHKPDLILTITSRMVLNFKAATTAIPIVGLMADRSRLGLSRAWHTQGAISYRSATFGEHTAAMPIPEDDCVVCRSWPAAASGKSSRKSICE